MACSINSAIDSINKSPHFVLFGTNKRLPYEFLHSAPRPVYNMDEYVKCRLRDFQFTHKLIHDRLTASQAEMLRKHHRATNSFIEVSNIVFARVHDRNSKLDPLHLGPHRVIESLHGHKIKILDLKTLGEQIVHVDHLKRVNKRFDDECAHQVSLISDLTDPSDSSLTTHTPSSCRLKLHSHSKV